VADLRFDVDQAVKHLAEETQRALDRIKEDAAASERELRAVAVALEQNAADVDVAKAEAVHVLEVDLAFGRRCQAGAQLYLSCNGDTLASSTIAREIPTGRYRVLVQFMKIEVCKRCGRAGHEASPPGEAAGNNCRRAI